MQIKILTRLFISVSFLVVIFFTFGFVNSNVVFASVDNIVGLVFVTESKSLAVDEVSSGITIQAQNSAGIGEKMDVSGGKMTISVSGGEISSSATNWANLSAPLTVNSNWTGRTVYYKSSSAGMYTISATLDVSGKSWTATQDVRVGISSGGGDNDGGTGTTTATSTDSNNNGGGVGTTTATSTVTATTTATNTNTAGTTVIYSVHYIQEDLSDYEEPTVFEVGAGRARLAYVNSPIGFVAKSKKSKDVSGRNCDYVWSFGDGVSLTGEKAEHLYKYPGNYNVVLNGVCGDLKSVARTAVKVLNPSLTLLQKADGAVEIFNQGKYEINLYGWKLQADDQVYSFPQDTIISAGQGVIFPAEYVKISTLGKRNLLVDAIGAVVAQTGANLAATGSDQTIAKAELDKFILAYKGITPAVNSLVLAKVENSFSPKSNPGISLGASVADVFVSTTSVSAESTEVSFWSKLFHPIRTIKQAFYQ